MKPSHLLAAVSIAPILMMTAGSAWAADTISTSTSTPVSTATATNGAPDNVDIAAGGSIGATASGSAVTLNSNNTVSVEGQIGFTSVDNAVGIQVQGGHTGSVTNTGSITVTDSYTPTTDNNTGLSLLPYALGTNRTAIQVVGPGIFTGGISNLGTITVHGDASYGVDIQAPITGDYQSLQYTAAAGSTAATYLLGTITVLGGEPALNGAAATAPVIGFHIGSAGGVGGNLTLGTVSATGYLAQGVAIEGAVGGALNFVGSVTTTGYRSTSRSSYPTIATQYTAQELEQGGSAVTIGANVGAGVLLSAPPLTAITSASTSSDVINGQSILQTAQPTATIATYGSAPAMVIGSSANAVALGVINGAANTLQGADAAGVYGLANEGTITGNGVYDPLNYPNLPGPVSGTALQIGVTGGMAAVINGGIYNTGGIFGQAYQANATGIHFLAGGATPLILNDGVISASSIQVNGAATGPVPVVVNAIQIDAGASVPSIVNNSGIVANITGTGGVGGAAGAIIDKSGSVVSITNTGSISAQATQTLASTLLPATLTAIDISAGVTPQTIRQAVNPTSASAAAYNITVSYSQGAIVSYNGLVYQATAAAGVALDPFDYPAYWREIGATVPFITGSVLFGNGGSTLDVAAGSVTGSVIELGTGVNTINIHGAAGAGVTGAVVTGSVQEGLASSGGNSTLTINVDNGTLSDTNPNQIKVASVNVGANGLLLVSADPANGTYTKFITSGASSFAQGAQVGITLQSIPTALSQTYTILQTVPGQGTLTAGTFATGLLDNAPYLFAANATYAPAADPSTQSSSIQLTVSRKSAAQLGFNAAEGAALDAVLAAAPANAGIQNALLAQTGEAGLKSVYDQLLPNQGQGLFDSLDAAVQAISSLTGAVPDPNTRVSGTNLWLQEVDERVKRTGISTEGSYSKLLGLIAGYEFMGGGGGAAGVTLAYLNASEQDTASPIGAGVQSSTVEAGAYYRREAGHLSGSLRVGAGYTWLQDERKFLTTGTALLAQSNWGALFLDGHAGLAFEQHLGRYYARPELSADFLIFDEGSHTDTGGANGFNLTVASRNSSRYSGQALLVLGREWGPAGSWFRTEIRGGFREILAGTVGETTASFTGGNPFTLAPENDKGGWATFGFSLKSGSAYSYLALEGDADFRAGERRYDLRIAGRSLF